MRLMGEMMIKMRMPGGVRITPEVLHLVVGIVDHRRAKGVWPDSELLPATTGVEKFGPAEDGGEFVIELQSTPEQPTGTVRRLRVLSDGTVVLDTVQRKATFPAT